MKTHIMIQSCCRERRQDKIIRNDGRKEGEKEGRRSRVVGPMVTQRQRACASICVNTHTHTHTHTYSPRVHSAISTHGKIEGGPTRDFYGVRQTLRTSKVIK